MSYKTILVHLDCGKRRSERLGLSVALAEQFGAYLIGVFAVDTMHIPPYAESEAAPIIAAIERKRRAEAEQEARGEFEAAVRSRVAGSEWRSDTGDPVAAVNFTARSADLVMIGQLNPEDAGKECVPAYFVEDVVIGAGKPVLVVPYAGHFPDVGKRVMVPWKPTREASRAVWDALPLLERSEMVEVVSFERGRTARTEDDAARADMTRWLERHGIRGSVMRTVVEDLEVGEAILSRAADFGADMIAMGAYGHSRLREQVFGGASRKVLDSMTLPVLMSH